VIDDKHLEFFKTFHGGADGSPRQSGCAREELLTSQSPIEARRAGSRLMNCKAIIRPMSFSEGESSEPISIPSSDRELVAREWLPEAALPTQRFREADSLRSFDRTRPTLRVSVRLEGLYT
jgi:hypothetical protein